MQNRRGSVALLVAVLLGLKGIAADPVQTHPDRISNSIGMELILVKPGELAVPDKERRGTRTLAVAKPYYLGMCEVTQEQWQKVMGSNPSRFKGNDRPVEKVRWLDCVEFCRKLSALEGRAYRLPSGDEWEYACRAGGTGRFCFGDDEALLGEYAWYASNSGDGVDEKGHAVNGSTHPVGQKKPNAWGFHDMHGNVHEWCADEVDPHGDRERRAEMAKRGVPMPGSWRMMRGGCYPHASVVRWAARKCTRTGGLGGPSGGCRRRELAPELSGGLPAR